MDHPLIEKFSEPSVFLKMIEFMLTLIAVSVEQGGLAEFGGNSREFFGGGALVMSITITSLLFICYLLGQQRDIQQTYFEVAFNSVMALFTLTAGSLIIDTANGTSGTAASHANTAGSFCIMNAFAYGIDAYFALVNFRSMGTQPPQQQQQPPL